MKGNKKCLVCNKLINDKIIISDLFRTDNRSICNFCLKENPVVHNLEVLPIEKYQLFHFSLLGNNRKVKENAYTNFLAEYYLFAIKNKCILLMFDQLDLQTYQLLDQLEMENLLVITIYRGGKYEI